MQLKTVIANSKELIISALIPQLLSDLISNMPIDIFREQDLRFFMLAF